MNYKILHKWNLSYNEATTVQNELRRKLIHKDVSQIPELVAGVDVSFPSKNTGLCVIVLLNKKFNIVDYI
ncbi:MAG: endonuclease V, partial [Petrotogales bacterium]